MLRPLPSHPRHQKPLSNLIPHTSNTTGQLLWEKPDILFKNHCFTFFNSTGKSVTVPMKGFFFNVNKKEDALKDGWGIAL